MPYYPFNSQSPLYRNHIGAAAAGTPLQLRLLLHRDAHCHKAFLRIRPDCEQSVKEIEMIPKDMIDDYRIYECTFSEDEGLYWYSFRYTSDYGEYFVTKTDTSLGVVTAEREYRWWQQTVYSKDFTTPDWLKGGIIYQIFPDRFFNSGETKHDVPDDRFMCSDWRKQPEYRQNVGKCSLGNDYYGGDLKGITLKLPYLKSLGVTCIYLNPIFEAHSNHRYNTANYFKIDSLLGNEDDFKELCKEALKLGIRVILDGVFSHTGDDSVYFNRYGRYSNVGASQSTDSPYFSWYNFRNFPNDYAAWWNVPSLPETKENDPGFSEFITGENGVLRYWLKMGAGGWRLDVADELPDEFLDKIRSAIKTEKNDAFLLGEVWEDASNKISYGARRRFLQGKQLDSVMNYPFANAIINFICEGDAAKFNQQILDIIENYPPCCIDLLMNHIGTHDTMRIITRLAKGDYCGNREWQSHQTLSAEEYKRGASLLKLAAVIQYTLPGVPSLFYGDEAGVQGYSDPFCRATFPWNNEDTGLLEFYRALGKFRSSCQAFKNGSYAPYKSENGILAYTRSCQTEKAFIAVNQGNYAVTLNLPDGFNTPFSIMGEVPDGNTLSLPPKSFSLISAKKH